MNYIYEVTLLTHAHLDKPTVSTKGSISSFSFFLCSAKWQVFPPPTSSFPGLRLRTVLPLHVCTLSLNCSWNVSDFWLVVYSDHAPPHRLDGLSMLWSRCECMPASLADVSDSCLFCVKCGLRSVVSIGSDIKMKRAYLNLDTPTSPYLSNLFV